MKTIEERAHDYGCKIAGGHYVGGFRGSMYQASKDTYLEIATEQRAIDIDKACAAYCKVCGHRKEIALPNDCRKDCFRYEAFCKEMNVITQEQ